MINCHRQIFSTKKDYFSGAQYKKRKLWKKLQRNSYNQARVSGLKTFYVGPKKDNNLMVSLSLGHEGPSR